MKIVYNHGMRSIQLIMFMVLSFSGSVSWAFPKLPVYDVTEFGAIGDSITLNSKAIQSAIDSAARNGGGTVYFPPGDYLMGTVRLSSNITLYLENGSTIWGSNNMKDYEKGQEHLIYAEDAHDIVITGQGKIDGNGPKFWDNGRLQQWYSGQIDLPRTSDMIRFDRCTNIVLQNVDVYNGAFWNIGFGKCDRITIQGITMRNGVYEDDGPNTDGVNLWNCTRVQISDCDIITGDDCIVVLGDSRDVTITNCKLQTAETALMISGVRNLTFSNSTIFDSGCGIGFRVWNDIEVDGVAINNIVMDVSDKFKGGGTAIYVWSYPLYVETAVPEDTKLPPPGTIRNIAISNVIASANGLVCINGDINSYIKGLTLDNIKFLMHGGKISELNDNPPYPYPIYGFHNASPYGMFFRHVDDLKLRNIQLRWNTPEKAMWGNALRCWSVNDLEIDGFDGRQAMGSNEAAIAFKDVNSAFIRNCRPPKGTGTFLEFGEGTNDITLIGNDFHQAKKTFSIKHGADPKVFEQNNRPPGK